MVRFPRIQELSRLNPDIGATIPDSGYTSMNSMPPSPEVDESRGIYSKENEIEEDDSLQRSKIQVIAPRWLHPSRE